MGFASLAAVAPATLVAGGVGLAIALAGALGSVVRGSDAVPAFGFEHAATAVSAIIVHARQRWSP